MEILGENFRKTLFRSKCRGRFTAAEILLNSARGKLKLLVQISLNFQFAIQILCRSRLPSLIQSVKMRF